jgi:uncharacterized pyridoxal phosphate-containing UPF0001 family protein
MLRELKTKELQWHPVGGIQREKYQSSAHYGEGNRKVNNYCQANMH